jgi:hypothetical protein
VALFVTGYVIARGANVQKHAFRKDPGAPLEWWEGTPRYVVTRRGPPLLVSGFWGVGRHLNYLGDLLLVHRERRDHSKCAEKYGQDWDAYCAKVRWRIVPDLY